MGLVSSPEAWEYPVFGFVMGQCQLLKNMGVPGIRLCHGSTSTPPDHGSAWHSTRSWVIVNSSKNMGVPGIRLCHRSTSTPPDHGSAWHSTRSWVIVNSSKNMGVPGIRLCHRSMSTPPKHGSAWHLTWSWVSANSSKTCECLAFDPVMGQCQLLNRHGIRLCHGSMSTPPEHGSAWHLTRSRVNVNSSSIRKCLVSMPTPSRGVETHCSVID